MSFTFPSGARRPVIDVNSENLMFVWNLPRWIDISEIKRSLQPKYGRIKFVETFEAWREGRRMGQIILDFPTHSSLSAFTKALSNRDVFNYDGVEFMCFDPKIGQRPFFNYVRQQTGVDLLSCGGVPPTFEYKRKGPSFEREQNPNNIPLRPRVRDSFAPPMGVERGRRYDRDDDGRQNGGVQARSSPRGVGRGFGQIGSRFGNTRLALPPSHSDDTKQTAAEEDESSQKSGNEEERSKSPIGQKRGEDEKEEHRRTDSPIGGFGCNPPSRNFAQRISRPKPSFFGGEHSEGVFSVAANEENGKKHTEEVSEAVALTDNVLVPMEENCPEDPEVDAAFAGGDGEDEVGLNSVQQQQEDEAADNGGNGTPSADDGEDAMNKSDERKSDSSFTQYREKSRSREDSVSDDHDGHGGGAGVKNTLKITELDLGFDISKILEALQTVGEVVRFERLGKTTAAFTFDDAAEAANASVLVVDDLAAPNAFFQLMTAEEAYQ